MREGKMILVEGGRGHFAHAHVDNVLDGVLLALASERATGETFILTDGDARRTTGEYFTRLADAGEYDLGDADVTFVPGGSVLAYSAPERLKGAAGDEKDRLEIEIASLEAKPAELKALVIEEERHLAAIEPEFKALWLQVPQPPSADVPRGKGSEDNVEIRRWNPAGFDAARPFAANRGFTPRGHLDLVKQHRMVDFERGVKMAGTRHYALTGWGMRLHQAVLRMAFDFMTVENGFVSVA
jgi:hypothetical protein